MRSESGSAGLPRMSPARAFATVFAVVFLFIFVGSAVLTFLVPETYEANARVVAPETAHLQLLQSAQLLNEVSQRLRLPETFGARYGQNEALEEKLVEDLLRRSVQVRRVRGTGLVEIRVYSRFPAECAQLANEIAQTSVRLARDGSGRISIVDRAVPPLKPSRPNKTLNLALGVLVGLLLGTMAGGLGARLVVGFEVRRVE